MNTTMNMEKLEQDAADIFHQGSTDAVNVLSESLPSDPQDPSRKNNITPKECNMNNENTSI